MKNFTLSINAEKKDLNIAEIISKFVSTLSYPMIDKISKEIIFWILPKDANAIFMPVDANSAETVVNIVFTSNTNLRAIVHEISHFSNNDHKTLAKESVPFGTVDLEAENKADKLADILMNRYKRQRHEIDLNIEV